MTEKVKSLYEEILEENSAPERMQCQTGLVLEALDETDRASLIKLLADRTIKATKIVAVLKRRGFEISAHNMQRHRRGECRCGRNA